MSLSQRQNKIGLTAQILCVFLAIAAGESSMLAQGPPVRRAQPVNEPPVARALPVDQSSPSARPRPTPAGPNEDNSRPSSADSSQQSAPGETAPPDHRQLEYARALFGRKLYDLAVPEFEKYLDQYPTASGRAQAYFFLGESYRSLNRAAPARRSFQAVLDEYGDSEYAGPAAYVLAETAFTQKEYGAALPLFHKAAGKSKEAPVVLSARYFEARCLEILDRKDDACGLYQQVIDAKNPNPYREDSRQADAAILLSRGKRMEALKHYEALSDESQKPALKAEAAVRAGLIAIDLSQSDKGKMDKSMADKATNLLQKVRAIPEAGKFRAIAEVGLLRLRYQSGQFAQVVADYKKAQEKLPEEARPEAMLLAGNAERQLGHAKEADDIYNHIVAKDPKRDEAKDAQYHRLINIYNSDPTA
ncbi:MAG: hypothetical protein JWO45_368, partial [Spartobacteria bacterium]|nr:hypothetical protein [Spartobacteria bacterium]